MKIKYIIRVFLLLIVSLVVGYNIYLWNAEKLLGNALPMPYGVGLAVVLSGSMEPTLSVNDLIIVKKKNEYNISDIVVYQKGYDLIVHRIVSINDHVVVTKGDANNTEDTPIDIANIKGSVIGHIAFFGVIMDILKSPIGICVVLGLTLIFLELSYKNDYKIKETELDVIRKEIMYLKKH